MVECAHGVRSFSFHINDGGAVASAPLSGMSVDNWRIV